MRDALAEFARERGITVPLLGGDGWDSPKLSEIGGSAIDGRTTRHPGYAVSQRIRKRIEEAFGWIKTVAGLRKTRHRGTARVGWLFTLTATACNLVRLPKLLAAG